jgi:hypothetical protein
MIENDAKDISKITGKWIEGNGKEKKNKEKVRE